MSRHCSTSPCDVVADVIGQISAPCKCFYKLWHRHRDVVICCHAFTFSSEKSVFPMLFFSCQQLPPCTRLFVNEYRLSRVRFSSRLCTSRQTATPLCPPFVSPLCFSPSLSLWSLAWKESLTVYGYVHVEEEFV